MNIVGLCVVCHKEVYDTDDAITSDDSIFQGAIHIIPCFIKLHNEYVNTHEIDIDDIPTIEEIIEDSISK